VGGCEVTKGALIPLVPDGRFFIILSSLFTPNGSLVPEDFPEGPYPDGKWYIVNGK